jgi:uncharacterized membrane protein
MTLAPFLLPRSSYEFMPILAMTLLFIGALVIAGAFIFPSGRIMRAVAFVS